MTCHNFALAILVRTFRKSQLRKHEVIMSPVSTSGETPLSLPHRCAAWRRQPRAAAGPWGTPPATSCSGRHRPVTNAPRGFCCRGHAPPRFAQRPPARLLRVFSASVSPPLVQVASGQRPVRRRNAKNKHPTWVACIFRPLATTYLVSGGIRSAHFSQNAPKKPLRCT